MTWRWLAGAAVALIVTGMGIMFGVVMDQIDKVDMRVSEVEVRARQYQEDRQFILDSIRRSEENVSDLQSERFNQAVRLAEIRIELINIRTVLERIEQRRSLD